MPAEDPESTESPAEAPVTHYRWLPTLLLEPGMVLARPVIGRAGIVQTLYVAQGATVNANLIEQLIVKGVECAAVVDSPLPDGGDLGPAAPAYERRLQEIFGPQPSEACRPLLECLQQARPHLC